MKLIIRMVIGIFCMVGVTVLQAAMFAVQVGDDIKTVYNVLGEPDSYILVGNRAIISYERGKVELISNKVVRVDFVSAAKAEELKRREAELRTKAIAAKKKKYAFLMKEGSALKQKKLEDVDFLSQPIYSQFEYWRKFKKRYPMVNLVPVNLAEMALQITEDARIEQAAALKVKNDELLQAKWKLMEAEERAHQAELAASRSSSRYSYGYTSYLWPPQIVIPGGNYPCRPRPTPYRCVNPVSPFRPSGGTSVVGGSGGSTITVAPHASKWPSYTPGVFPNTAR